jgi:ubiquinone/menaquinone biosynthesis C-methylase UbiE
MSQNDPQLVRREYADESRLAARASIYAGSGGPEVAFAAVAEVAPGRVLEVGCGRGEFAARVAAELGAEVVALDLSERMVELTRARGLHAVVADVQELPFTNATFDCAVANWMLYHVPDVDQALRELARVLRPGGRLVAATNAVNHLAELWSTVGRDLGDRWGLFMREAGAEMLRPHFERVERRDLDDVLYLSYDDVVRYVSNSVAHRHLAARVEHFDGVIPVARHVSVFVADASARHGLRNR